MQEKLQRARVRLILERAAFKSQLHLTHYNSPDECENRAAARSSRRRVSAFTDFLVPLGHRQHPDRLLHHQASKGLLEGYMWKPCLKLARPFCRLFVVARQGLIPSWTGLGKKTPRASGLPQIQLTIDC